MFDQIKVELCSVWGGDRDAALGAWASTYDKTKAEGKTDDDVRRLVTDLVHLHHDTPKERVWLDFFITCPIFVERQFDKYRMTLQYQDFVVEYLEAPMGRDHITQNELSGRYRTIPDRPYSLPADVDTILRRADRDCLLSFEYGQLLEKQHRWYQEALRTLRQAEIEKKITNTEYKRSREVLRGVLGTSFLTDMRVVMNMNAFEHIINQRLARAAQMESRVVACRMIKTLESGNAIPVMLDEMVKANGWQPLVDETVEAINEDGK